MALRRNILSNAGGTALGSLAQLLLVLGLAHWLSVAGFSVYVTAAAVIGFGEMVSDFGVRIWAARQFSLEPFRAGEFAPAIRAKALFSLLLLLAAASIPIDLLSRTQAVLAALVACSQPSSDPLLWYLRGRERLDLEAWAVLAWRLVNVASLAALAILGASVDGLLVAWLAANLLRIAAVWWSPMCASLRRALAEPGIAAGSGLAEVLKASVPIGIAFAVMAFYQRQGVLTLGRIGAQDIVAAFGAAFTLVASAGFVATSITVSSFPSLARAVGAADWSAAAAVANAKLNLVMAVFAPACLVGMLLAPPVVDLLLPASYARVALAMICLLPGLYISTVNLALKYLMNAVGHNWWDVGSVLVGVGVFQGILLLAEPEQLLQAAGIGWGVGEAAIFMVKWTVLRNDARTSAVTLARHLAVCLALFAAMTLLLAWKVH